MLSGDEWNTYACYSNIKYRLLEVLSYDNNVSFKEFVGMGLNDEDISCLTDMYGQEEALRQAESVFNSVKKFGRL